MTQYQNPMMNVKFKITGFCNWSQSLWYDFGAEVFRCRILILMKTGFFLLIQIFNQEIQKSLDFGTEHKVLIVRYYGNTIYINVEKL